MGSFKVVGSDGLSVHVYEWLPQGEVKAVLQIAHGMAEHGARYERFAKFLNDDQQIYTPIIGWRSGLSG